MRVKRLLTVALMALFGAGTATAASQLNSVQISPKDNSATISLKTTGSFAHKEYRPDDHLVLVDLNGVTADASVERTASPNSGVLKSYKLTNYTSASGAEVTRIELVVGDGVKLDVSDLSDGLQIVLHSGALPSVASSVASSPAAPAKPLYAQPVTRSAAPVTVAPVPAKSVQPVTKTASAAPAVIRGISVARGKGTLDVIIRGPHEAAPFLLQNPDRLVIDFANAVVRPPIKTIAVNGEDVIAVRVGRFQAAPPVTRVVVDLSGPRTYDVISSAGQVTVRVKNRETEALSPAASTTPVPVTPASTAPAKPAYEVAAAMPENDSPAKPSVPETKNDSTPARGTKVGKARPAVSTPVFPDMKPEPPKFAVVKPETAEPEADQPQTSTVSTPGEAKPEAAKVEAAKAESPKVDAAVIGPAPAKSTVMASESIGAAKPQMAESPAPAAIPTPAVVQPAALQPVPAAAQPVLTAEAKPAAAQSVIPQVSSVQDRVLSVNETAQPRDGELATASSDPSLRAGRAAEKMAATPQNEQPSLAPRTPSSGQAAVPAPKYTGEPISVNLKDVDLKDFFRLIHEISGLNIVLDPNVRGSLTLVLDDVPWDQALDIVLKNGNLDRELQGNVLRIASTDTLRREAVDRRAQSEAIALAVDRQTITRSLSYAKASEAVPTIKKFLTARGDVISDQRTNTLIISDIPSVLPALDRLITTLDRKSEEVEIEVRVVSATRSFSRDLGVQLGFSWGNGVTTIGGSNPNSTSGTSVVNGVSTTSTIPLFSNFGASGATTGFQLSNITSNYGIDAVLTAAESHNLAKVLSRPRVVTQNNIKAEIKQGQKIPVYTQGTNNANSSVSYIDAVLRLSVTPQITADKTIFMTVDVENTQPNGTTSAGNYLLSTQQETTQVLVTDGGTVVIGGVIQTTNSVSTSQTPFLGSIPWLGNLFKERLVSTSTAELIFFITPKIVQM